jgi:hypothetical protein
VETHHRGLHIDDYSLGLNIPLFFRVLLRNATIKCALR